MSLKIIAIGNKLMGDDGIAIYVLERLMKNLESLGIEVIIGEVDFQYCLGKIDKGDYIVIIDATWFGLEPGTITVNSLRDIYKQTTNQGLFSQHGYSLVKALEIYYRAFNGMVIGIEGNNFDFSLSLSQDVEASFDCICNEVYEIVLNFSFISYI